MGDSGVAVPAYGADAWTRPAGVLEAPPTMQPFYAPPPPPPAVPGSLLPGPGGESGLRVRTALVIGAVALLLSLGLQLWGDAHADITKQLDGQLRLSLVVTVGFYVVLGGALGLFCLQCRVGLTWVRRGTGVEAILWGLPLGAAGGGVAVYLNSHLSGHLSSDPNVEVLVGGGGALRIGLTLVVTAVLAPLVEETLFRGILAGTLLARGPAPAVWVSAIAFSVWHMNPTSLRYYVFMGLMLATLWRKRGLVASMAAHAAFNGVLTIAAVVATTSGGQLTSYGAVSFQLPGGWHTEPAAPYYNGPMVVDGPGGAGLVVESIRTPGRVAPTLDEIADNLAAGGPDGGILHAVVPGSVHRVHLSTGGEGVVADLTVSGQPGHLLAVVVGGVPYELIAVTAGSPAAEKGWTRILASVSA